MCAMCCLSQYGVGQWGAIKMAIRRSPKFRFDYYLRSLPLEMIARRCEHLMRLALKEVDLLERKAREDAGLPAEAEEGQELPPIVLPKYKEMQKKMRLERMEKREKEKEVLEKKVDELDAQIKAIQERLKYLSNPEAHAENGRSSNPAPVVVPEEEAEPQPAFDETEAALGPNNEVIEFPEYDASEPPKENKKTFAWFCNKNRKEVKASLNPEERKNKEKINGILKEKFMALSDEQKGPYRQWAAWDKKRYLRDVQIYESRGSGSKRRASEGEAVHVPKKKRREG